MRTARGFEKSPQLRVAPENKPCDYFWTVADRVGETLRVIVVDQSETPGHHVYCSGFRLEPVDLALDVRTFPFPSKALERMCAVERCGWRGGFGGDASDELRVHCT